MSDVLVESKRDLEAGYSSFYDKTNILHTPQKSRNLSIAHVTIRELKLHHESPPPKTRGQQYGKQRRAQITSTPKKPKQHQTKRVTNAADRHRPSKHLSAPSCSKPPPRGPNVVLTPLFTGHRSARLASIRAGAIYPPG
jgi:hypothetical protein